MGVMRLHAEGHRGPPRAAGPTGSRTEARDGFSRGSDPANAGTPDSGLCDCERVSPSGAKSPELVVSCYNSHRELIQPPNGEPAVTGANMGDRPRTWALGRHSPRIQQWLRREVASGGADTVSILLKPLR